MYDKPLNNKAILLVPGHLIDQGNLSHRKMVSHFVIVIHSFVSCLMEFSLTVAGFH